MSAVENDSASETIMVAPSRPERARVFYANAVNWVFSEHEAFFDFKFVVPEDFRAVAETELADDGLTRGTANVNLDNVPIEARIVMPVGQFLKAVERMAELHAKLSQEKEPIPSPLTEIEASNGAENG
jgi:hypothetical protein